MKIHNILKKKIENKIIIGKFGKAYGILGWIKLFSFTEQKKNIFNYSPWFILEEQKPEKIYFNYWKKYKNDFIINIKNVSNRSILIKFTNKNVFIENNQLPKLKNNEYYWKDIIQCQVLNTKNKYLGNVIDLIRTVHNDILVVQNKLQKSSTKNILIPIIYYEIIQNIDIFHKVINVKWDI